MRDIHITDKGSGGRDGAIIAGAVIVAAIIAARLAAAILAAVTWALAILALTALVTGATWVAWHSHRRSQVPRPAPWQPRLPDPPAHLITDAPERPALSGQPAVHLHTAEAAAEWARQMRGGR